MRPPFRAAEVKWKKNQKKENKIKLIKLTLKDGEDDGDDIYINPAHIVHVKKMDGASEVRLLGNEDQYVEEEPQVIERMIAGTPLTETARPLVIAPDGAESTTGAWRG